VVSVTRTSDCSADGFYSKVCCAGGVPTVCADDYTTCRCFCICSDRHRTLKVPLPVRPGKHASFEKHAEWAHQARDVVNKKVDGVLGKVLSQCLATCPFDRPQIVGDIIDALRKEEASAAEKSEDKAFAAGNIADEATASDGEAKHISYDKWKNQYEKLFGLQISEDSNEKTDVLKWDLLCVIWRYRDSHLIRTLWRQIDGVSDETCNEPWTVGEHTFNENYARSSDCRGLRPWKQHAAMPIVCLLHFEDWWNFHLWLRKVAVRPGRKAQQQGFDALVAEVGLICEVFVNKFVEAIRALHISSARRFFDHPLIGGHHAHWHVLTAAAARLPKGKVGSESRLKLDIVAEVLRHSKQVNDEVQCCQQ